MIETLTNRRWLLAGLFGLVAVLVYGQVLGHGFVDWDDTYLLTRNPIVRAINLRTLWFAFSTYDPELYIPLTFVSYQLTYLFFGASSMAVHAVNILLHAANAFLVVLVLRRWLRNEIIAVLCGLLFLVHPLHSEAVAWASARKDLLSGLFFLLALHSTLHAWDRERFPRLGLLWFLCALLSKVTAFTLPIVLLLERWRTKSLNAKTVLELVPFFALSIAFGCIAILGKEHVASNVTAMQSLTLALRSVGVTIVHAVVPLGLLPIYEVHDGAMFFSWQTAAGIIAVIAIGASVWASRHHRTLAMASIAFLALYAPSFLTFSKGSSILLTSDRYAYLPSIALLLALGIVLDYLWNRKTDQKILGGAAAVLMIFGFLSARQAGIWKNSEALFGAVLAADERSVFAATNLGVYLTNAGRLDEAEGVLRAAAEREHVAAPWTALGTVLRKQGKTDDAIGALRNAVQAEPQDPGAHFALADALLAVNQRSAALQELRSVLAINPRHAPAMQNLAALLYEDAQFMESEELFKQVLKINPYYSDAHYNYALLLRDTGRPEESAREFIAALDAQPSLSEALQPSVEALLNKGDVATALTLLGRAIEDDADNPTNGSLALATIKRVLSQDPRNAQAKTLLERMFALGIVERRTN